MKNFATAILAVVIVASMVAGIQGVAFGQSYSASFPNIEVSLLKYSPLPAEPGKYVTLTFKVENTGGKDADNVRLKIVPEYPFSLDSNSTVRIETQSIPLSVGSDMAVSLGKVPMAEYILVDYDVRVAQDVLEGTKQLKVWDQTVSGDFWVINTFNVLVQGSDRLEVANVEPSTLTPGKPTNVTFVLYNSGTASIRDVAFTWAEEDNKILPLGSGNKKYVDSIGPNASAEIPFTLVADPSATSGVYTLSANITYIIGVNISKSLSVNIGMFIGGNGEFEVSMQDSLAGSTSFSIANVGSNPATSVSVKIPEQENFAVTGQSSSFVGDLNPGEFTSVSFQITPKSRLVAGRQNASDFTGRPDALNITGGQGTLKIEIDYTDTNSYRQAVVKDVQLNMQSLLSSQSTSSQFGNQSQRQSGSGMNLIIMGVAGIVLIVVLVKYGGRIKNLVKRMKK